MRWILQRIQYRNNSGVGVPQQIYSAESKMAADKFDVIRILFHSSHQFGKVGDVVRSTAASQIERNDRPIFGEILEILEETKTVEDHQRVAGIAGIAGAFKKETHSIVHNNVTFVCLHVYPP